jgi:hypothetical protein
MELILKCLKNLPRYRPSIGDVFDEVSHTASRIPPTFTDRVEGLTTIKSVAAEVEEKQRMMGERDMCIQDLITVVQEQEEHCQAEIQRVIEEKEEHSQAEIRQAIEQEVHKHVEAKAEIRRLTSQNLHCQAELQAAKERECAKDAELKRLRRNTQQLQADLLALLDASLQEARQQIAKEAQSDVCETVSQQSADQNTNQLSNESKNLQPHTEQRAFNIQAPQTATVVAESTPLQLPLPPFSANGTENVVSCMLLINNWGRL